MTVSKVLIHFPSECDPKKIQTLILSLTDEVIVTSEIRAGTILKAAKDK